MKNKAIFLDRDGVLNPPVLQEGSNIYGAPLHPEDYILFDSAIKSLKKIELLGFKFVLISNQPDFAKGKTSLESLKAVHSRLDILLKNEGINFLDYYYCYHHPDGIIPEYTQVCECRKPGNLFIRNAIDSYNIDPFLSWIIGDRDTDIVCGQRSSLKTIQIKQTHPDGKAGKSNPDYKVNDLFEAAKIIEKLEIH